MSDLWYDAGRDEQYISDQDRQCPACRDFQETCDMEDVARWRALWLPSCRVCPREPYCYVSHRMQGKTCKI